MDDKNTRDNEEFRDWFKSELDRVVEHMLKKRIVAGVAIDATPVWAVPNQILIAKVWPSGQKTQFIWTISGPAVVTDHVAGAVAVNPRDVANHFALKWQGDAERILRTAATPNTDEAARAGMKKAANKLIKDAESLFDMAQRDDIWG
jgi:hypothetical protein